MDQDVLKTVIAYIAQYQQLNNQLSPTLREIAQGCFISKSVAARCLDIHSSLNFNLTTAGGALLLGLTARIYHNPGTNMDCYFDANINGTSQGGSNGIYWVLAPNSYQFTFSTTWLTQPLAAGAQTVKIQCKRGGNNSNPVQIWDVFAWVQEVS